MRVLKSVFVLAGVITAGACDTGSVPARSAFTISKGLVMVNEAAKEISFTATFHRTNAEAGTWHLIVESGGSMASMAFFTTDVSPGKFYESLKAIGASDGNNVNSSNFGDEGIATQGDAIELLFDWKGRKTPVALADLIAEVVPDLPTSGGARGLDMRFGGNFTAEDAKSPPCHESGCLACLYTCSAGVTSNARANLALLKKEKDVHRYRVDPKLDLPDGTRVRVIARKKA